LFIVQADGDQVNLAVRQFIGTAFFVTSRGHAITAAHVLPVPQGLDAAHRLIGVVRIDGISTICGVTEVTVLEDQDLGLVTTNLSSTKPLPIAASDIYAGQDVQVVGFPEHEVRLRGKEFRLLKGYVSLSRDVLELSFAIPPGMSGAPVFAGANVVAYATGRVRSEEIEDQTEELIEVSAGIERIRINTTSRIAYYGIARSFHELASVRIPSLGDRTLLEFIKDTNSSQ